VKILVIADPHIPVPPINYGGAEREIDLMCQGLTKRGHEVHLMAGPGSKDYGGGLTIHHSPSSEYFSRVHRKIFFQFIASRAARGADIIINHGRLDYLEAFYRTKKPAIHWLHNPLTGSEVSFVLSRRSQGDCFVGVSHSQVASDPEAARFEVIYNAVDTEKIPFSPTPVTPPYLVFLGRLTENKGVHTAIEAARRARIKLIIGGNMPKELGAAAYFETSIKPHLGPECEWIGPYDEAVRLKLLSGATALLFPIQWNEPFGIVMIEALASGVPVIASRIASTPEVITEGKTGFLCDSTEDMVAAIHRIKEISRSQCRTEVEERFSEPAFIRQTEDLITRVVAAATTAPKKALWPLSSRTIQDGCNGHGLPPPESRPFSKKQKGKRILMIADPMLPVPPKYYGGTERGINLMCEWLVKRGHRVHLMAGPGSKDYGGGLTIHRPPSSAYYSRVYRKILFQCIALRAVLQADLVINHGRIDYLESIYHIKKPVIHWLHNPLSSRETKYILRRQQQDIFVGLSRSQVSSHASCFEVVYNARDMETLPFSPVPATPPYVVCLGRLTRNKGPHVAIEVARRVGIKLVLGGNLPNEPGAKDYFETEINPHLGPECKWIGPYDNAARAKLLSGATALLFPIHWMEPFGSVMIEALACGVPVIASRTASTPEVITHGKTGYLCDSVEEMVTAVHRIKEISREQCRTEAEERFSETAFMRRTEQLIARAVQPCSEKPRMDANKRK
jgi:glycosyltransferase involved in cell wall biosynthesis